MKILVSSCLLGEKCRYDGCSKPNYKVIELLKNYECIPVCPEVMGGLPTPRMPSEIQGDRVIMLDGTDVTSEFKKGAETVLKIANENGCSMALLKSKSPSCGKGYVYDGTYTKTLVKGNGVCAGLLMGKGINVIDETEIEKIDL